MKFTFVSKRLWDKYIGKSQHYSRVMFHRCEKSTKMTRNICYLKRQTEKKT